MAIAWAVQDWRIRTKRKLVEALGGCCNRCQYDRCVRGLCFHHVNPKEKRFGITDALARPKSWQEIAEEARKCILLCLICHAELHSDLWSIDEIRRFEFQEPKEPESDFNTCVVCGERAKKHQLCCGRRCAAKRRERICWPDNATLIAMLQQSNMLNLSRQLGVSDNAVRKRLRRISEIR